MVILVNLFAITAKTALEDLEPNDGTEEASILIEYLLIYSQNKQEVVHLA